MILYYRTITSESEVYHHSLPSCGVYRRSAGHERRASLEERVPPRRFLWPSCRLGKQRLDEGCRRGCGQLSRKSVSHYPAALQHGDPGVERHSLVALVRHVERRRLPLREERAQKRDQVGPQHYYRGW